MLVGIPKEIKKNENRVAMVPELVSIMISQGHEVLVEEKAGLGVGFDDADYEHNGAKISSAKDIFKNCELIVKVKEPQPEECNALSEGQVLFTYLHLAADANQTKLLCQSGATAIAYETVTDSKHRLPLLIPMSEVAGRVSTQAGAFCLQATAGGKGILLGGISGVASAEVTIIGGGIAGTHAAQVALGMGANVTIFEKSLDRLRELEFIFNHQVNLIYSTHNALVKKLKVSDMLIGSILIPGASAPKIVTRKMIQEMPKGSVIVDIAIDQGGCCETSMPTTHESPTFIEEEIVHYCVSNIPSAVPLTSTYALNHATFPYISSLAKQGWKKALSENPYFAEGLNICKGQVTYQNVAASLGMDYVPASQYLS